MLRPLPEVVPEEDANSSGTAATSDNTLRNTDSSSQSQQEPQPQPLHSPYWVVDANCTPLPARTFLEQLSKEPIRWDGGTGAGEKQYNEWSEDPNERAPFNAIRHLGGDPGKGATIVERVRCTKQPDIILARKLVDCVNDQKKMEGRAEIKCLEVLRHPHIVAFVGKYLDFQKLGILMYPAAEWNLAAFMDQPEIHGLRGRYLAKRWYLRRYFVCLSQALDFLHNTAGIRHKDIKPKNILIDSFGNVLLSDFGLSKKYRTAAESVTQTELLASPEYSTPEFIRREPRGPYTDVYALGIIFAEMATVILDGSLDDFQRARLKSGTRIEDHSYHSNPRAVRTWLENLRQTRMSVLLEGQSEMKKAIPTILKMLAREPNQRPVASELWNSFKDLNQHYCPDCDPRVETRWKAEEDPISQEDISKFSFWDEDDSSIAEDREQALTNIPITRTRETPPRGSDVITSASAIATLMPTKTSAIFTGKNPPKHVIVYDHLAETLRYQRWNEIRGKELLHKEIPRFGGEVYLFTSGRKFLAKINLTALGTGVTWKRWMGQIRYIFVLNVRSRSDNDGSYMTDENENSE